MKEGLHSLRLGFLEDGQLATKIHSTSETCCQETILETSPYLMTVGEIVNFKEYFLGEGGEDPRAETLVNPNLSGVGRIEGAIPMLINEIGFGRRQRAIHKPQEIVGDEKDQKLLLPGQIIFHRTESNCHKISDIGGSKIGMRNWVGGRSYHGEWIKALETNNKLIDLKGGPRNRVPRGAHFIGGVGEKQRRRSWDRHD